MGAVLSTGRAAGRDGAAPTGGMVAEADTEAGAVEVAATRVGGSVLGAAGAAKVGANRQNRHIQTIA